MIPKPPDTSKFETPSACESCEVSKDVTDSQALTYIPYPVKKFVCEGCLESAGKDLNDLVESQQFDIAEVDEDSLNDFCSPIRCVGGCSGDRIDRNSNGVISPVHVRKCSSR